MNDPFPPPKPLFAASVGNGPDLDVELMTAAECVWRGPVSSAEVRFQEGSVDFSSPFSTYLQLGHRAILSLRSGEQQLCFQLEEAIASRQSGKLTIIASAIFPFLGEPLG